MRLAGRCGLRFSTAMLEDTLNLPYVPGRIVKGDVPGAAWTYALPSLELGRVVSVGRPEVLDLRTLAALGRTVTVWCATDEETGLARRAALAAEVENVTVVRLSPGEIPQGPGSADLIVLSRPWARRRFQPGRPAFNVLRHTLKPSGRLFYESRHRPAGAATDAQTAVFHLSPAVGAVQAVVPLESTAVTRAFSAGLVDRPVLSDAVLARLLVRPRPSPPTSLGRETGGRSGRSPSGSSHVRALGRRLVHGLQAAEQRVLTTSPARALFARYGVMVGPASGSALRAAAPPAYLQRIAQSSHIPFEGHRYTVVADGDYESRKTVFFLFPPNSGTPNAVVKMSRSPRFNDRVLRERNALVRLAAVGGALARSVPATLFFGHHHQRAVLGQTLVPGRPFGECATGAVDGVHLRQAVGWLTELAVATAATRPRSSAVAGRALESLIARFAALYPVESRHLDFLERQAHHLRQAGVACPSVFLHGDPHTTNLIVADDGAIGAVDWEASDPQGMPLWDLFFFLRAYGTLALRGTSSSGYVESFGETFLHDSPLSRTTRVLVGDYCAALGITTELVAPLFYTCWVHRALRESFRLSPERLARGHYLTLLARCIDQHDSAPLQQLFGAGAPARTAFKLSA